MEIPEVLNETRDRFTGYGYLDAQQADPYRVAIRTPVSEIERLVSFMDDKFQKGLYAIDIRDGQLGMSLPEKYGLGSIIFQPYSVHGPNTRKYFTEEFRQVFDRLNGDVLIHVDPEGGDLAVVHTDRKGAMIRHSIETIGVNGKLTLRNQGRNESG
ncbi:hypothetical protein DM867_00210 [Halosegnis rubeus]|uniref:Uncharacterized protein n=1 Tax=Halosegnis rubeus TaxID=2212850 RepID=A0A5N5UB63_9EURY|nr:hypothetical protein [Halosegnis rubeus]KAB7515609.1 hypothetical protein DM867_00210 [Halosegnis rubeus]